MNDETNKAYSGPQLRTRRDREVYSSGFSDGVDEVERKQPSKVLSEEIDEAERKAIDSLARYKFAMFGYWAGIWVHLNRIEGKKRPNPFKRLVKQAQLMNDGSVCAENPEFCIGPIVKTDIRQYQCLTCEKRVEDANK